MSDPLPALILGEALRRERIRRGLSQADVARELGTTQQSVGRWERGQHPQPRWQRAIKKFLEPPRTAQVVRLPTPEESTRDQEALTEQQSRIIDAVAERLKQGPLSAREIDLLEATYRTLGLEW